MKTLRVGVIGLGMGRHHVSIYQQHRQARVVAIADVDTGRLQEIGDKHNVPGRYTDVGEMLSKEELDVVSVTTPNFLHKPLTLACLKAGCHVLCEKPMAMNAAEARQMNKAAAAAGKRIMINFSQRFRPQTQALKREVDKGVLGDVYFARTTWLRRKGLPGFGGWFGQKQLSGGGPLIDLGVHRIDLALWLMGYPKPVWVMGETYNHLGSQIAKRERKQFDVEDMAVGLVKFENGATLEIEASWAGHIKERELMHTRLLGTKGGLVHYNVQDGYQYHAEIYTERKGRQVTITPRVSKKPERYPMTQFIDCILKNEPHDATGEQGYIVMQLLDAIYKSAQQGRPIRIKA